jgi:hypothetical protein
MGPTKSPEEKAAELSASKDWPDKADPVLGKMHSIGWVAHREGFLAGVEWARKEFEREERRRLKEPDYPGLNPRE